MAASNVYTNQTKVPNLANATKQKNTILTQGDKRKSEFESLQSTMVSNLPETGREIYLTQELYDSNILKSGQESKKEK